MHPNIPGPSRWALAGGFASLALVTLFVFRRMPWMPLLSLAQIFAIIGLVYSWSGFRRFLQLQPTTLAIKIPITVLVTVLISVNHFSQSVEIRAVGNSVIIALFSGFIAWDLLKSHEPQHPAHAITGWIYAANALVFLLRALFAHDTSPSYESLDPNGVAPYITLWWMCATIASTLGMILMTSERLQQDLDNQANLDPLTGALNRRAFSLMANKTVAHSKRYGHPLSILILDIDHFKSINDQLGHDSGDRILCQFVSCANQNLREGDVFCRFGGEEFVALLPNTSLDQARLIAERLRTSFATFAQAVSPAAISRHDLTVSIGIAEYRRDENISNLLRRADTALYRAKDKGRNRCEIAHDDAESETPYTANVKPEYYVQD